MLTVKLLLKLLAILNKDATPQQIAGGMALGAIIGMTPAGSLHNLVVLVLIFMIRVNITSAFLAAAVFKLFSYLLDPLFNRIGYALLVKAKGLHPAWEALYNTPIVPWTEFNNTLTLGSLVFALLIFWPLYFAIVKGVIHYRVKIITRIQKWRIVQILKASKWFELYQRFAS
jgi:uncharacterized protein (TIGR03546 family)